MTDASPRAILSVIDIDALAAHARVVTDWTPCATCDGGGIVVIERDGERCPACDGTGGTHRYADEQTKGEGQ